MLFLFDDYELDTGLFELRRRGEQRAIEPKAFDLLAFLIENRDRLVTKDEIHDVIWKDRIVSDATLNSCINSARKAIGDTGKEQNFIKTYPRRGFRFVADVQCKGPQEAVNTDHHSRENHQASQTAELTEISATTPASNFFSTSEAVRSDATGSGTVPGGNRVAELSGDLSKNTSPVVTSRADEPKSAISLTSIIAVYKGGLQLETSGYLVLAKNWRVSLGIGTLVLTLLVSLAAQYLPTTPSNLSQGAMPTRMAYPMPERPSILVLPLKDVGSVNKSGDHWFADGITEDLITDLSRNRELFVISRNSSFAFNQAKMTIREIAKRFGVRYVLEGSVRRDEARVRINARLIDTTTAGTVWADRYDGNVLEMLRVQGQISQSIVDALTNVMNLRGPPTKELPGTANVAAYDAYLRGLALYRRKTPRDNVDAVRSFERSIRLDPDFVQAKVALAKAYIRVGVGAHTYAEALNIHWSEGIARAWRLIQTSSTTPNADRFVAISWLALRKHQHERAISAAQRALDLQPNSAEAMEALAQARIFAGDLNSGRQLAERALRQSPGSTANAHYLIGLAAYAANNLEEAVAAINRASAATPDRQAEFSGVLAAALGELGRTELAKVAYESFNQGYLARPALAWTVGPQRFQNPRYHTWRNVNVAWAVFTHPFRDPLVQERFAKGLKEAGAPAGISEYLSLSRGNRLAESEIKTVLFDAIIIGSTFWLSEPKWRQERSPFGVVKHSGLWIHAGFPESLSGRGKIRRNLLCEIWSYRGAPIELCSTVYRVLDERSRLRWGDYVVLTDIGVFPFRLAK